MSRPLRVESPNTFYHVLSRGNERRPVFWADRDYMRFLEVLGDFSARFAVEVWSYVLMPNHYHVLLRTRRANLSQAMHWLGVAYVAWFNAKHRRAGHLFQGRFKSFIVEEEGYLQRLILYMHRNPLRAGMAHRLANYRWSSYPRLAYDRKGPEWFDRSLALSLFAGEASSFRAAAQAYSEEDDHLLEELRYGLILGSRSAVDWLRAKSRQTKEAKTRAKPQLAALDQKADLVECVARFRRAMEVPREEIQQWRHPLRRTARPERDLLIWSLRTLAGCAVREVADFFNITPNAIPFACTRAEKTLAKNKRLRKKLDNHFGAD